MTRAERKLWARVYAAEYDRLQHMATTCFQPRHEQIGNFDAGCAVDGDKCERIAAERADRAVELLRERIKAEAPEGEKG